MNNYEYYDYLAHFGIKGMKWGVRRFQSKSGKLTSAGKKRYYTKNQRDIDEAMYGKRGVKRIEKRMAKGRSHVTASAMEMGRQVTTGLLISTAVPAALFDIGTGGEAHRRLGKMAINAIKNEAAQRAAQRANKELAKIGQYKMVHIVGDVYEKVMG